MNKKGLSKIIKEQHEELLKRRVVVKMNPDLLGGLCKISDSKRFIVKKGLPQDAKFIGTQFNFMENVFDLMFISKEFPIVPDGIICPVLEVVFSVEYKDE